MLTRRFLSTAAGKRFGFIGLGRMGYPMAGHLIKKSNPSAFHVYDVVPSFTKDFTSEHPNATATQSPIEVAANSDFVITMLPNTEIVKEVYLKEMWGEMGKGKTFVDCSTIDIFGAKEVCEKVNGRGDFMVDAPVSGGVAGAKAGTLTFMVGAPKASNEFSTLNNVLSTMGKNVFPLEQIGNGQIAKLCNNMLLAIHMIGLSEALNLGRRLGVDPELLTSIIQTSTGKSWSGGVNNPVPGVLKDAPSSHEYEGGFTNPLISKDLGLAVSAANSVGANVTLGSVACMIYNQLKSQPGFENKDFSSIFKALNDNVTK